MKKVSPILIIILMLSVTGCSKDDKDSGELESRVYTLHSVDNPDVQGKVTISEKKDGTSEVLLEINGSSTDIHPAFIYNGDEAGSGAVAITLNPIDCDCESSTTTVSKLNNGTAITYKGLKAFNGHIKIHQSVDELGTVIARGNIGVNAN